MKLLWLVLFVSPMQNAQQPAHKPSDPIEEAELSAHLAEEYGCEANQVYFWKLEHFDFLGKGYGQAVVVASTCMTGTAGPDVHSVYTRDEHGQLQELRIQEVKLPHRVLFGNPNSTFRIENGLLVDVYGDTSDRDDPLVIKYKWDAANYQFVAVSVVAAKRYPTSYDCDKAEKDGDETALAICYVKSLADLDLELAKTYRTYLGSLSVDSRKAAVQEQRTWLEQRNKKCVIYKWWVECLTEAYTKRIAEFKEKTAAGPKTASIGALEFAPVAKPR